MNMGLLLEHVMEIFRSNHKHFVIETSRQSLKWLSDNGRRARGMLWTTLNQGYCQEFPDRGQNFLTRERDYLSTEASVWQRLVTALTLSSMGVALRDGGCNPLSSLWRNPWLNRATQRDLQEIWILEGEMKVLIENGSSLLSNFPIQQNRRNKDWVWLGASLDAVWMLSRRWCSNHWLHFSPRIRRCNNIPAPVDQHPVFLFAHLSQILTNTTYITKLHNNTDALIVLNVCRHHFVKKQSSNCQWKLSSMETSLIEDLSLIYHIDTE